MTSVQNVADRLKSAGMDVSGILESIGTITGSVDPSRIAELHKVEGVSNVSQSRTYRIAPPGSEVE